MAYPLEVGGVDDYPVKVGSMLLTLVEPHKGFEKAYNRWYERDHYYAGCMVGPWLYAGSRWVATRPLKDLRWPAGDSVAKPLDNGSFVAIYWIEKGHHDEHIVWATDQVRDLYANGRGFSERSHVHTALFNHIGAHYRDDDPVPVDICLEHGYDGIVALWWDAREGTAADLFPKLAEHHAALMKGTGIEIASAWTPSTPGEGPTDVPMDLGSPAGNADRLVELLFLHGDPADVVPKVHAYTDAVEAAGLADLRLAAPFLQTVRGTDKYVDQLW
jgi:hypothetical protein